MGEIVNLRQARKRKRRSASESTADANRVLHGRSSGEKKLLRSRKELEGHRLDQHRRERADPERDDGES